MRMNANLNRLPPPKEADAVVRVHSNVVVRPQGCTDMRNTQLSKSQAPKRLLKRKTAVDVEILKEEMEDVKKTLASLQSLLTERYKKKRVSFAEDLH
ncbi:hypothetical protein N7522_000389 [Penicillium canescens]|nr:hypothetical protein N7522_000389 [Penicillium canescens]